LRDTAPQAGRVTRLPRYLPSPFRRRVARGLLRRLPVLAFGSADRALLLDHRARAALSR